MGRMTGDWGKSSYSGYSGSCVEARAVAGGAQVRDTKDRKGPVLTFSRDAWSAFVAGVKSGEHALPA